MALPADRNVLIMIVMPVTVHKTMRKPLPYVNMPSQCRIKSHMLDVQFLTLASLKTSVAGLPFNPQQKKT